MQDDGDVVMGIVPAGQVAGGIKSVVRIADLVPGMVEDAVAIFQRLGSAATVSA